jgi:membrane-bound ClpP family serine protease
MKLRHVYLCLCFLGAALPLSQLGPWLIAHGLNLQLLVTELFSTRIGAFFGLDVIVSGVVLLLFIAAEGRRVSIKTLWVPIVATFAVGVSLGFPLFLYMRQLKLEAQANNA